MNELPSSLKIATLWLVLGTAVFLGFSAWQSHERQSRVMVAAGGQIELKRGPDGHFHWPGRINGQAVEFLVDTGATATALPEPLARRLGLASDGGSVSSHTAGGTVQGWQARADLELAGGVRAERLRVTVLPALGAPLLGMDVLSRLRFSQDDGVLRIEPRQ